jgi:hypothetical protein
VSSSAALLKRTKAGDTNIGQGVLQRVSQDVSQA